MDSGTRAQGVRPGAAALLGVFWFVVVLTTAGNAVADPPPALPIAPLPIDAPAPAPVAPADTVDPAGPPPPATILFPLAQHGAPVSIGGLPAPPDLSGRTADEFVLAQAPAPSPPGDGPAAVPSLNALNNQYLLPQNLVPSAPGEGEIFGVEPGQENAASGRIDYLKRLYGTYREGGLKGGLLGQMPLEQVGKPLSDNALPMPPAPVEPAPAESPPLALLPPPEQP